MAQAHNISFLETAPVDYGPLSPIPELAEQ